MAVGYWKSPTEATYLASSDASQNQRLDGHALRHARRHRRPPRLSRPTANTSSRFRTSASAASFPASSWRSSSTASARTSGRTAASALAVGMTADARRHAGSDGAGPRRLAPRRRDVHRHQLSPEPRHHPAVRSASRSRTTRSRSCRTTRRSASSASRVRSTRSVPQTRRAAARSSPAGPSPAVAGGRRARGRS